MATDVVQYALLGLISVRPEGAHGYQLKVKFDALYGDFWSLNYGQLYRTLDRLERAGLGRLRRGGVPARGSDPQRRAPRAVARRGCAR